MQCLYILLCKLLVRTIITTSTAFLQLDPALWEDSRTFRQLSKTVRSLTSVNDCAERGVKVIQEFNKLITNDEEQKQYLLLVVSEHRKYFGFDRKDLVNV